MPALVTLAGAVILIPLSPALIFGWGPFPRLGVAGGGVAVVIYYVFAALALISYLRSSCSALKLRIVPLQGRLFKDILGVGLLSAIGTVQVNLTVTLVTAAVGRFGAAAIAGYGIASRLDYIQIPLLFGLAHIEKRAFVVLAQQQIDAGMAGLLALQGLGDLGAWGLQDVAGPVEDLGGQHAVRLAVDEEQLERAALGFHCRFAPPLI